MFFIFGNDINDVFDVGMIFVLIVFVVDWVIQSEVCCREDDLVMNWFESCSCENNIDIEGADTLCESIILK